MPDDAERKQASPKPWPIWPPSADVQAARRRREEDEYRTAQEWAQAHPASEDQVLYRIWLRIKYQGLIWMAGFILFVAGIICLYLSDQVVTGWWQGTLDAFGVGFIVGGIVDVLAISALNQRGKADDDRTANGAMHPTLAVFRLCSGRRRAAAVNDADRRSVKSQVRLHTRW
jgi:hypothetical protein